MASFYELWIPESDVVVSSVTFVSDRFYVDPSDPDRLDPISQQVAFCRICERIGAAESFLTPAECERILEQERSLDDEGGHALELREMLYGSHAQFAERLRIETMRMPGRVSPPRCLECGSTEILTERRVRSFQTDYGRLYHPDYLPEGLEVRFGGLCSPEYDSRRYYDREGREVGRST